MAKLALLPTRIEEDVLAFSIVGRRRRMEVTTTQTAEVQPRKSKEDALHRRYREVLEEALERAETREVRDALLRRLKELEDELEEDLK